MSAGDPQRIGIGISGASGAMIGIEHSEIAQRGTGLADAFSKNGGEGTQGADE
jgi:hypothetical protein